MKVLKYAPCAALLFLSMQVNADDIYQQEVTPLALDFLAEKPDQIPVKPFTLKLNIMRKLDGQLTSYTIKNEEFVRHDNLVISARQCLEDYEGQPDYDIAWLEVADQNGSKLFQGWQYTKIPSVTGLDHPQYALIFTGCEN